MTERFKTIEGTPTQRFVGYMLADAHNDNTGRCDLAVASLVRLTSLSERTVQDAIKSLECNGHLTRIFRQGTSTQYNLHPRSSCTPAVAAPPQLSQGGGATVAPLPPQLLHPTPAAAAPKPEGTVILTVSEPQNPPMTDDQWMSELKTNPAHNGINIAAEFQRAHQWCQKNNRQNTRRFFQNWLTKCEKPLTIKPKTNQPQSCL
jgi:hypothetical protein